MARLLLSLFGVGLLPGPQGTYASLATAAAVWLSATSGGPGLVVLGLALAGAGSVVTVALGGRAARAAGEEDPSFVVTDEVAGQGLALALAGALGGPVLAPSVLAFLLFRLFDVTKPGPVRALERAPGGWGILLDDLLAGAFAGALTAGAAAAGLFRLPALGG